MKLSLNLRDTLTQFKLWIRLISGLLGILLMVAGFTNIHPGLGLAAFGYLVYDLAAD